MNSLTHLLHHFMFLTSINVLYANSEYIVAHSDYMSHHSTHGITVLCDMTSTFLSQYLISHLN